MTNFAPPYYNYIAFGGGGGIKITILVQSFLVYITIIMNKFFFQMYRSRHGQVLAFSHGP